MRRFVIGWLVLLIAAPAQGQSGAWQPLADFPGGTQELATAVLDGKIYAIGGLEGQGNPSPRVYVYNPFTNIWAQAAPLPFGNDHHAAAVADGKLYVFGGVSPDTYVYDPVGNTWKFVARMQSAHNGTPAAAVIDGKIYCAGGSSGATSVNVLEVFDPQTNTWTRRQPMSIARNHCAGAAIDGKFYVAAGRGSSNAGSALEVYDPATNSWSRKAPMPTPRSGVAAAAVNGELFVFGGEGSRMYPEVEAYNPRTDSWRRLPDMPTPRHGIWASVIGNKIYLPGGATVVGFGGTGAHEVFIVDRKATFANISSRLRVETGENVLIAGFIVTGSGSKRIAVRGLGPSLAVEGSLADPELELYNAAGEIIAANNNWRDAANAQELADATLAPPHAAEAAVLVRVNPGNHTAVLRGVNGSGVGLVEVYDLESGSESKPANISTRGLVQTGDNILIAGLILTGSEASRVVLRAIGPSLQVSRRLEDPTLELRDADGGLLAANDNWRSSQESEVIASGLEPTHDREAVIVRTLPPSHYTAIVRGAAGSTGVAVVEAYSID